MLSISLRDFLDRGHLGPLVPGRHCGPEDVLAALGAAEDIYAPHDLDLPYRPGDSSCFPLIVAYGDVEFHFDAHAALSSIFVDGFSADDGAPSGGALRLVDASGLREGIEMQHFLDLSRQAGIEVTSVRSDASSGASVVTTCGGVEIGFEHAAPGTPVSSPVLRWFCWMPAG